MTGTIPGPAKSSLESVTPVLYLLCAFTAWNGFGMTTAGAFANAGVLLVGLLHLAYSAALAWAIRGIFRETASARLQVLCLMWIDVLFEGCLIVGNLHAEDLILLLLMTLPALVPAGAVILVLLSESLKPRQSKRA